MRPLHPIDLIFLSLERRQQPMHVGGLFLFKIPENAQDNFIQNLVADIRKSKSIPVSPFNHKLNGLFWDKDSEFDLDHHFRHISLPHPGRIRELLVHISQEHSALLDRAKPLWTCTLIEGIEDNRFALYFKIHHALVDGIGSMRLMEKSFAKDPYTHHITPPWSIDTISKKNSKNKFKAAFHTVKNIKEQITTTPQVVYQELKQAMLHDRRFDPHYVTSFQAPKSIFNQRVSASRRFAAQSFDLARIRHISNALNVTLNDAILAICSGALRQYLINLNQLPEKPLIAMVPASIRTDDSAVSNRITMILANLATHTSDHLERIYTISNSVRTAKMRFKRMTQNQILSYSAFVYAAAGLNIISGVMPKKQAFNIVISNVPGPKETLYWNGAPLEAIYPASVVFDGQALNITLTSYQDKLEVGLVACRNAVPRIQTLITFLEDEIRHYEKLIDHQ
ncbi:MULTISPECIES: WS/DGAT/MGAT family O-acyltransferase [Acinetobacter]|uniref:WS/DGAT/MGAT family O-acyltransferase n=1 Tax=Acinetobacter TaxID=469 RepID=UPI0018A2959A|nr:MULTISPECIES: wax ester/triacylglycerol synthase family O-acyltransferase [Acinetobacter]MBF7691159.1 wax ester/triacylglycerol synthase family O-acyltransferase [Acinetobacter pollinis]MBF7693592.1 wax ester/triacylglycerol synthase family O-acyltransferase [Acinetobacter pollinis]MBF7698832.1 wax ester/triacylglycerol synthase family O-acyltransferase [Acinetobacter pollinis]MBF7699544.1 wax ester/triacylglycerol synthase family O-acyltransferase [Acinetobacter pollinis]WEV48291.1 wax est